MGWESKLAHQMLSPFCLFRTWMTLPFALLFLYQLVVGFGFLSFLFTSLALLFSTIIILFLWKHKSVPEVVDALVEENVLTCEGNKNSKERENIIEAMKIQEEEEEEEASDDSELDGSISDEDSLIEIALPSGNFVGQQKEEWCSLQQQSLLEFLAEFNNEMYEEENLIEIDISMGSIKCSRFEIEAK